MIRIYICLVVTLVFLSACISEEDINAITFDTVENTKLEANKESNGYFLYADLVLKNKNNVHFSLYDLNLEIHWKDEVINVVYNAAGKVTKFDSDRVTIPLRGYISNSFVQKNLLGVALGVLSGNKSSVKTKGYIIVKKWMFKKQIEIEKTLDIGM